MASGETPNEISPPGSQTRGDERSRSPRNPSDGQSARGLMMASLLTRLVGLAQECAHTEREIQDMKSGKVILAVDGKGKEITPEQYTDKLKTELEELRQKIIDLKKWIIDVSVTPLA